MRSIPVTALSYGNLYLVSFMGSFGYFLLIPILLQMIKHNHQLSHGLGNWLYAIILSLMPLSCILTSPILGRLSDYWQRKTLILAGCWLNLLSFALSLLAVVSGQVTWLIVGSIMNGFAANAQPLSQAAIADLSQGRNRAKRFGLDACSMALATVIGPLCGYYLADKHLVSWFSLSTPFYLAMLLAAITIVFTWRTCPSKPIQHYEPPSFAILWHALTDILRLHPILKRLIIAYFLMQLGWAVFYQNIGWFFTAIHHGNQTALFLAAIGIGAIIGLLIAYPILLRFSRYQTILLTACLVSGLGILIMTLPNITLQWLMIIPVTVIYSFYYPTALTVIVNRINHQQQGWIIAWTNALLGFAWFLSSYLATLLHSLSLYAATICVGIMLLIAWLIHY